MTRYVLKNDKKCRLLIAALWLVYASSYFIRTCYAASIVSIIADGKYDKGEVGLIGTAFFICYGVGQLISGLIGDKANPFFMIIFGSCAGGICCFLVPAADTLAQLLVIWGINGLLQSMLWSPILRIFSETIDKKLRKKAILNISLSLPAGTVCAYLIASWILKYADWRLVFVCGGVCIILASAFVLFAFFCSKRDITKIPAAESEAIGVQKNKADKGSLLSVIFTSGLLMIIIPSFLHGMMRDGITNWVPAMITELYGVSSSFSVLLTMVLPVFNAFGAYAIMPLYKKLGEDEMKTAGAAAVFALLPLALLMLAGRLPVYAVVLLLALTTSAMYALNYLIISLVPVRFSNDSCTSSVSGILNSAAHIGCAVSSYGFGAVSEKAGWSAVILLWIAAAFATAVFSFLSDKKWKRFIG